MSAQRVYKQYEVHLTTYKKIKRNDNSVKRSAIGNKAKQLDGLYRI